MKQRLIVCIAAVMLALMHSVYAKATYDSGKCGDNVTWKLDYNGLWGLLTISGTGDMYDYDNGAPWCSSYYYVNKVTISDGVSRIGNNAFYGCRSLASVTIPNSVTTIGNSAFYGCRILASIEIPSSVTTIGNSAFYRCSSLANVNIGNSVTTIGNSAFYGCSSLTSVTIPNSVTTIERSAFSDCSNLTSVTIPSSVTTIGSSTFWKCSSLTSVTIPNSVTTIGNSAFYGCSSLTRIEIPESVTTIGSATFLECSSLTSVIIPNSVTEIGRSAFLRCNDLAEIKCDAAEPPVCGNNDSDSYLTFHEANPRTCKLYVPEQSVDKYRAADPWKDFRNITYVLDSGSCGDSITWTLDADRNLTLIGTGEMCDYDQSAPWGNSVAEVSISDGITKIGSRAFSGCSELTGIVIPASIALIGDNAFSGCSKLAEIDCKAVKPPKCGADVFDSRCTNLCKLYVPQSSLRLYGVCDVWEDFKFVSGSTIASSGECGDNVTWTLDYDGNLTISGTGRMDDMIYTAWNAPQVMFVAISDGITNIGSEAFRECENLVGVQLPNSVTEIGYNVFAGCRSLNKTVIPNSVTTIRNGAFQGCSSLTSMVIPNSVTEFGDFVFANCISLTSVAISNSVTAIGYNTFYYCKDLTSVEIPNLVTAIGVWAFYRCSSLTSIKLPNSVTEIGKVAFEGCSSLAEIKCEAAEPPSCDGNVFNQVNTTDCKLYVPEESIDKYRAADEWKDFSNIIGLAGVDDVANDSVVTVTVTGDTLVVEGADAGELLEVYNTAGAAVYRGPATSIVLPGAGIYLVKISGKVLKLAAN